MPHLGETRRAPCPWCGTEIHQTWEATADVPGGFWDVSECTCGSFTGLVRYGNAYIERLRAEGSEPRRQTYRHGKRRA